MSEIYLFRYILLCDGVNLYISTRTSSQFRAINSLIVLFNHLYYPLKKSSKLDIAIPKNKLLINEKYNLCAYTYA